MTKILNIDDLLQESPLKVIIGGVEHAMTTPTMGDFLANMKDLEALAASPNIVEETRVTVRVIARAFPSLTEEDVYKWPVNVIENLFNIVRGVDPDAQVASEDAAGNPLSAT